MSVDRGGAHASRMDAIYRRQRHIYNVTRKYYLFGRDRLISDLAMTPGDTALEIGCGTGRNLVQLARRYPGTQLFGLDISAAMLETAQSATERAGLEPRISLAQGDATGFDPAAVFGHSLFDRVYFSYTLSMIPDWAAALRMAMQLVAPGGSLHIVDFGQQEHLPGAFRSALHRWLKKFDVAPVAQLPDALKALAAAEDATLIFKRLYRGYAWQAAIEVPARDDLQESKRR